MSKDYTAYWAEKRRLALAHLCQKGDKEMFTPDAILDAVIKTLVHEKGDLLVSPWFTGAEALGIKQNQFFVAVSNDLFCDTLSRQFSAQVAKIVSELTGSECVPVFLNPQQAAQWRAENDVDGFYANYTFERFIVGNSNKFAHAAAYAVALDPATKYNPLYIYGQSGLGKTHLLYAIAGEIRKSRPDFNIVYRKGDDFTNELVESIEKKTPAEFRALYRKADLLLVDDIQFIAGRERTQEEFFHTFNALYDDKKQIVLTSDRPPRDIAMLTERLRTRFEAGLLADVQPPDLETRMALVNTKSELLAMRLPTEVVMHIANAVTNNVRELEGVVKKVFALYDLMGKPLTIATAEEAIQDIFKQRRGLRPTPDLIFEEVSIFYGIPPEKIKSNSRTSDVLLPRQVAAFLIRKLTSLSLPDIGKVMGQHHTTVHHAIGRIETEIAKREDIANAVKDIQQNIQSR